EADNIIASHPFYDRDIVVMNGLHVTIDAGSGCVHTAPGHGEEDFYTAESYGIEAICPVDEKGVFTDEAPEFEGVFYDNANKIINNKLQEACDIVNLQFNTHMYTHDWRTKKTTICQATSQWFASKKALRDEILQEIKKEDWRPHRGET